MYISLILELYECDCISQQLSVEVSISVRCTKKSSIVLDG